MVLKPVGSLWLKERFSLPHFVLTHSSYIGNNASVEMTSKGNIDQVYGAKYGVAADEPLHHVEFSLKYDDLNLEFLNAVFERIPAAELENLMASAPAGKYARSWMN